MAAFGAVVSTGGRPDAVDRGQKEQLVSFIRYNAVLALVAGVVLFVLAISTMGLAAIGYLAFFYWAYQAAQGQTVQIPVLSDWIKEQGWVER